jgi:hypothetical protein
MEFLFLSLALFSSCSFFGMNNNLKIQKEGAYILFSLTKAELSNLHLMVLSTCIQSNLSALKSNKYSCCTRTTAYLLQVPIDTLVRLNMDSFVQPAALLKIVTTVTLTSPFEVFSNLLCRLAQRDADAPASYSSAQSFHGLLSMRFCTVCPCFKITASVSQLASSTGWFFHFTRYS